MKIIEVEPILCDGGFRTWIFVKVSTDEGITGYGDASMWQFSRAVAEAVKYLANTVVVGEDPKTLISCTIRCGRKPPVFWEVSLTLRWQA